MMGFQRLTLVEYYYINSLSLSLSLPSLSHTHMPLPENHMINCIPALILTVLNLLTRKERGKILAARPIKIRIRLHMIRLKLNDVEIVNTCIPMYRNTTVSAGERYNRVCVLRYTLQALVGKVHTHKV